MEPVATRILPPRETANAQLTNETASPLNQIEWEHTCGRSRSTATGVGVEGGVPIMGLDIGVECVSGRMESLLLREPQFPQCCV